MDQTQLTFLWQLLQLHPTWEIYTWLATLSFSAGISFGTFASKSWVRSEIDRSLKSIDEQLQRIDARLDRHIDEEIKRGIS